LRSKRVVFEDRRLKDRVTCSIGLEPRRKGERKNQKRGRRVRVKERLGRAS